MSDVPYVLPVYNWQEYLYDLIPESKQKEANQVYHEILDYHGELDWQNRIRRRNCCFF